MKKYLNTLTIPTQLNVERQAKKFNCLLVEQNLLTLSILLLSLLLSACTKDDDNSSSSDPLQQNACSTLGLNDKVHDRIVNGTVCQNDGRSPVVRVVLTNALGMSAFCSGTMITKSTVLTAAHCFLTVPREVVILSGETVNSSQEFTAQNWLIHPSFAASGNRAIKDVAIIRLATPTNLPTVPVMTESKVKENEVVSIFGYGKDEDGNFNFDLLKSGEMRVHEIDSTHIIAKFDGEGSNTCQGDSGGPLLSSRPGRAAIAGITSSGLDAECQAGDTSFFTNLRDSDVKEFIKVNVPNAEFL